MRAAIKAGMIPARIPVTIQVTTAMVIVYVFGYMLFEIAETGWKICIDSVYEIPSMISLLTKLTNCIG